MRPQTIARFNDLRNYNYADWDDEGALPLTQAALAAAEGFINRIGDECLRPYVYPTREGGVQVEFHVRTDERITTCAMDVWFKPDGKAAAVIFVDNEWIDWEES